MYAITLVFFLVTAFNSLPMRAMSPIPKLEEIKNLNIGYIKQTYTEPGQTDYILALKFLWGLGLPQARPDLGFPLLLNAAQHRIDAVGSLKKSCEKGTCFPNIIEQKLDELLAQAPNNKNICALLYELQNTRNIPDAIVRRIRNGLQPLYQSNPDILFQAALKIGDIDKPTMVRIFHELADNHHYGEACLALGQIYESENIVEQNFPEALRYYDLSADYGSGEGSYRIGQLYLRGIGTDQNKQKAFDYIQRAADLKFPDAVFDMGTFYLSGDVGERNVKKAIGYFKEASERGEIDAYTALGRLAEQGFQEDGTQGEPNYKKAFALFEKAYQMGSIQACYDLAFYYDIGRNAPTDHDFAKQLYNKVVQSNDSMSVLIKAYMYEFGVGVEEDLQKALSYYKQALADGNNVQKYIERVDDKIAANKDDETTGASEADTIKIPAVEKVEQPSATNSKPKKPTAAQVAYTKLKSDEAAFMQQLNDKFSCPDESMVTQVDFINNFIRIERPSDNTEVIIKIDPTKKQRTKRVKHYIYDNRVKPWFEQLKNPERLSAAEYDSMIRHAFPQKIDYLCQLFGYKTFSPENNQLTLSIEGQLIPGKTKIRRDGSFRYGYNPAGNVRNPLLYHRFHHNPTEN